MFNVYDFYEFGCSCPRFFQKDLLAMAFDSGRPFFCRQDATVVS